MAVNQTDFELNDLNREIELANARRRLQAIQSGRNPDTYYPGDSSSTGLSGIGGLWKDLADQQFSNTARTMDLANQYRTKEGATQGQVDEQMFRRLSAELEARKYLAANSPEWQASSSTRWTNWLRNQDLQRARSNR